MMDSCGINVLGHDELAACDSVWFAPKSVRSVFVWFLVLQWLWDVSLHTLLGRTPDKNKSQANVLLIFEWEGFHIGLT